MEAKERRSGNPSSIAWKPAAEICYSFSSSGSSGVPTETVAKEKGIASREDLEIDILGRIEETGE